MINPLELRLGNYVLYNGQTAIVSGINSPAPRKDKNFDGKYIIELVLGGLIDCVPEELEPVILTEEILLKLGFLKTKKLDVFTLEPEYLSYLMEGTVFFEHGIQYTHQLQNLLFSITGEELSYGTRTKR